MRAMRKEQRLMAEGQFRQSVGGGCRSENAVNCGSEQLSDGGT
jgi:hypothetical protein